METDTQYETKVPLHSRKKKGWTQEGGKKTTLLCGSCFSPIIRTLWVGDCQYICCGIYHAVWIKLQLVKGKLKKNPIWVPTLADPTFLHTYINAPENVDPPPSAALIPA